MVDETNVVRVCRFIKALTSRNPVTKLTEARTVHIDWGIGRVDGDGGYFVYGPPTQIFAAGGEGGLFGDSRVLIMDEYLPQSNLTSAATISMSGDQYLHFKYPNI